MGSVNVCHNTFLLKYSSNIIYASINFAWKYSSLLCRPGRPKRFDSYSRGKERENFWLNQNLLSQRHVECKEWYNTVLISLAGSAKRSLSTPLGRYFALIPKFPARLPCNCINRMTTGVQFFWHLNTRPLNELLCALIWKNDKQWLNNEYVWAWCTWYKDLMGVAIVNI